MQVLASGPIAPLSLENPLGVVAELSEAERSCIFGKADVQRLPALMSFPGTAAPEEIVELIVCLEDETLLRLFLTQLIGLSEPLSEESSTCIRAGAAEIDISALMSGAIAGSDEEAAMMGSTAALFLTLSCLSEEEYRDMAPALGMNPNDHEALRCVTERLGGPGGVTEALQPADGGPPLAFFGAAMGCGVSMEAGPGG